MPAHSAGGRNGDVGVEQERRAIAHPALMTLGKDVDGMLSSHGVRLSLAEEALCTRFVIRKYGATNLLPFVALYLRYLLFVRFEP